MEPVISLAAEPLFHIGTMPITNTLIVAWVIVLLVVVTVMMASRRYRAVPRGVQNLLEVVFEGALSFMTTITGSREKSRRFFPVVMTIFLFVILSNWVEIVPGLGSIGLWAEHEGKRVLIPFIRSSSADLNVTLALAIASVVATQIIGIASLGLFKYAGKFFVAPWKSPYLVGTFVGILELISECAKMVSFSFRLFGNIFAGEVLLLVVGFLAPYLVPLPFLFLEILVGFVQALVFSMLTLVFMTMAATPHEEHAEH